MRRIPGLGAALAAFALLACGGSAAPEARGSLTDRTDAGVPPVPDAGPTDAGPTDAGPTDAGSTLATDIAFTETGFDLLAVDPAGTAYGVNLGSASSEIWASGDGRAWAKRGRTADGSAFWMLAPLSDGTLLADVVGSSGHAIARSTDHGATWSEVQPTGVYRTLTPHSFAELDGAAYFLEYQVFTGASTAIRLWRSVDRGATWAVRHVFQGHRHGHGMASDPLRHALWAFFGDTDAQSGTYRSTDGGLSWTPVIAGSQDGDLVDAAVLPDGSLLCGQDISYQPPRPGIATIGIDGTVNRYLPLPSASYSTHAIRAGGYVVGATYEIDNDVSPSGWTRGSLWGSADGVSWEKLLEVPQLEPNLDVRTDVYWELPSGELVVNVQNAAGFGAGGRGYLLLRPIRQ
jgi:hypothetical protein